jgi:hypothetical protein
VLFVAGLFGFNFLGTLYLQRVEHYSPLTASFAFLPLAAALAVISLGLKARLILRFGPRQILLAGLVLVVAALGLGVLNTVAAGHAHDLLISGQSQQVARYAGLHLAFFVAALTVAAGLLIGVILWWQEPKKIRSFSLKNLRPL